MIEPLAVRLTANDDTVGAAADAVIACPIETLPPVLLMLIFPKGRVAFVVPAPLGPTAPAVEEKLNAVLLFEPSVKLLPAVRFKVDRSGVTASVPPVETKERLFGLADVLMIPVLVTVILPLF